MTVIFMDMNDAKDAITFACKEGRKNLVEILLDSSEGLNIALNALMYVCTYGKTDVVKLLRNSSEWKNINLNITNDHLQEWAACEMATVKGYTDINSRIVSGSVIMTGCTKIQLRL